MNTEYLKSYWKEAWKNKHNTNNNEKLHFQLVQRRLGGKKKNRVSMRYKSKIFSPRSTQFYQLEN